MIVDYMKYDFLKETNLIMPDIYVGLKTHQFAKDGFGSFWDEFIEGVDSEYRIIGKKHTFKDISINNKRYTVQILICTVGVAPYYDDMAIEIIDIR